MDEALNDILTIAATLTVVAIVAAFTWKAVSKPRLRLVYDEQQRQWTATRRDVIQYAVSIPFLISLWGLFFAVLLILLPNYDAENLIFVPTGFVIAIRVLAHIWREPAVEFAKMVPIVVVTSAIILVQLPEWDEIDALSDRLEELEGDLNTTLSWAVAVAIDFAATTLWFFYGVRRRAPKGANVPGIPWRDYPAAGWMRQGAHEWASAPVAGTNTTATSEVAVVSPGDRRHLGFEETQESAPSAALPSRGATPPPADDGSAETSIADDPGADSPLLATTADQASATPVPTEKAQSNPHDGMTGTEANPAPSALEDDPPPKNQGPTDR